MKLGVISDTHGHLDPRVFELFDGVDAILHAGDFETEDTLIELGALAPVHAVAGNCDYAFGRRFPRLRRISLAGRDILLCHIAPELGRGRPGTPLDPALGPPDVLVHGHTHRPRCERRGGVLLFNPGFAGRGQGRGGGRTVGFLRLGERGVAGRIAALETE